MQPRPLRLLAIDLTAKGFGFALLDVRLGLLDWGFSSLLAIDDAVFLERVSTRIERGRPTALVLENFAPIKGRDTALRRRDLAIALAAQRKIGLCQVSQKIVQGILGLGRRRRSPSCWFSDSPNCGTGCHGSGRGGPPRTSGCTFSMRWRWRWW